MPWFGAQSVFCFGAHLRAQNYVINFYRLGGRTIHRNWLCYQRERHRAGFKRTHGVEQCPVCLWADGKAPDLVLIGTRQVTGRPVRMPSCVESKAPPTPAVGPPPR